MQDRLIVNTDRESSQNPDIGGLDHCTRVEEIVAIKIFSARRRAFRLSCHNSN